jgi:uncharacterized protein (DUF2141 family)
MKTGGDKSMKAILANFWVRVLLMIVATNLISSLALAEQSSISVVFTGLRSQDEGFPICADGKTSFAPIVIKASDATITAVFQNIPSGDYAISAFHDEDENGRINRGFMGRPEEGLALSNMSTPQRRERPSFDRSKFTVNGEQTISLSLNYF